MALNPSVTTLSGLLADRPLNPGAVGVFYFATDTSQTFCWDGVDWIDVSGGVASAAEVDWLRLRVQRIAVALTMFGINIDDDAFSI